MSEASTALTLYTAPTPALRAAQRFLSAQETAIQRRLAPFRGLTAERFSALVLTEMVRTPQLQECMLTEKGQASLGMAVMELAQYGMQLGGLGHGYVVPFFKKSERYMHATAIFGWKGLLQLVLRSPLVRSVDVEAVYDADDFDYAKGTHPRIVHVPRYEGPPDYLRLTYVYAVCHTKHGGHPFVVLSRDQVQHYRSTSKQPNGFGWKDFPVEMAKKTAVRRGFPLWPVEDEFRAGAVAEEEREDELGDEGILEGGEQPAAPPRVIGGRDRRRRAGPPPPPPPPPDEPAAPGTRPAAAAPPPDRPTEPGTGGAMTPLQFLHFACQQADIDEAHLMQALYGEELLLPPSAAQVQGTIKAAQAITRGELRLVEVQVDGGMQRQLLPVVDDSQAAASGQTRMPGT